MNAGVMWPSSMNFCYKASLLLPTEQINNKRHIVHTCLCNTSLWNNRSIFGNLTRLIFVFDNNTVSSVVFVFQFALMSGICESKGVTFILLINADNIVKTYSRMQKKKKKRETASFVFDKVHYHLEQKTKFIQWTASFCCF